MRGILGLSGSPESGLQDFPSARASNVIQSGLSPLLKSERGRQSWDVGLGRAYTACGVPLGCLLGAQ